jgi:hypothetical protein
VGGLLAATERAGDVGEPALGDVQVLEAHQHALAPRPGREAHDDDLAEAARGVGGDQAELLHGLVLARPVRVLEVHREPQARVAEGVEPEPLDRPGRHAHVELERVSGAVGERGEIGGEAEPPADAPRRRPGPLVGIVRPEEGQQRGDERRRPQSATRSPEGARGTTGREAPPRR